MKKQIKQLKTVIGYFLCLRIRTLSTKKEKQYVLSWVCLVGTYSWKDLKSHPDDERSWHSHISSLVSTFINWCFHLIKSDFSEAFPKMFIGRRMFFPFTKGGNGKKIIYFQKWNLEEMSMRNHSWLWSSISCNTKESFYFLLDWKCLNPQRIFFQAAVVSILLNGCTTWMLSKWMEKKLDSIINNIHRKEYLLHVQERRKCK